MRTIERAGDYYHDCRDYLRIDLDRKMHTYNAGAAYAADLTRVREIERIYGFEESLLTKAVQAGLITGPRKYRNRDTHSNLYDANEISLRASQIEALRGTL
jgi:hypothetical protein